MRTKPPFNERPPGGHRKTASVGSVRSAYVSKGQQGARMRAKPAASGPSIQPPFMRDRPTGRSAGPISARPVAPRGESGSNRQPRMLPNPKPKAPSGNISLGSGKDPVFKPMSSEVIQPGRSVNLGLASQPTQVSSFNNPRVRKPGMPY